MLENSKSIVIATLVVALLGSGGGALAWLEFFQKNPEIGESFSQDDFDSPVIIPFYLKSDAHLRLNATAAWLAHNPNANGNDYPYSGLSLSAKVDGKTCKEDELIIEDKILDGRKLIRLDIECADLDRLERGPHLIEINAEAKGSCTSVGSTPETCKTKRIRGAFTLVE